MTRNLHHGLKISAEEKRALLADLLRRKAAKSITLPMSFSQQRLWFLDQLEQGSSTYNISRAVRLRGQLNLGALQEALNAIVKRHEALRTNFAAVEGHDPVQVISPSREIVFRVSDLRPLAAEKREDEARRLASEEARIGFDLSTGELLRVFLLKLDNQEHVLVLTIHHIISDGWSIGVLFRELGIFYDAFANELPSPLPELPIQYGDFARWQREWLRGERLVQEVDYWKQHLAGAPALLELPADKSRPAIQTFEGAYHTTIVPRGLSDSLKDLSQKQGATLFMTLLAAFQTMLYRYTHQEDIVVGTPIANRTRAETEDLIGFFVNTLIMRTDLSGNPTFRELLGRVRKLALEAYAHQDLPFERLVEELQPERSLSHMSVFQVLFALQNVPKSNLSLQGLELQEFGFHKNTSKLDLSLYVGESSEGLTLTFEYSTDLFEAATIEQMARHFHVLLQSIVANPDEKIAQLPLLTETDRHRTLVEWNDAKSQYVRQQPIHQVFEHQVIRSPDSIAAVFEGQRLTYRELNERANRLANYLRERGVRPEIPVGVLIERSLEMLVAFLGILKAGGAYVPIDPTYPNERLHFIIRDAEPQIILSQESLAGKVQPTGVQVLCIDRNVEEISCMSQKSPPVETDSENLAYIIYTSGSTGNPKGVAVTNGNVVHLVDSTKRGMGFQQDDIWTTVHSSTFDFSVWEIWGCLLQGGRLVVVSREVAQSSEELYELLKNEGVTVLNQTPSALRQLLEARRRSLQNQPDWRVRLIICGGDALDRDLAAELAQLGIPVWNFYGPTEATVWATSGLIRPQASDNSLSSIGQPLPDIQVYLLDKYLRPVPVGVSGELYIGGAGLARSYFQRPDLTAEKFVPNPFQSLPGGRLYRTGDLARYRRDGSIEFLGRLDHQVKLRGFRIELGEIEAAVSAHPGIARAVALIREVTLSDKKLVVYFQATDRHPPGASELRSFLQSVLPDYMVPSAFVVLEELPLTPNKKVDRRALLTSQLSAAERSTHFVAPRTPVEEIVANVWAALLGVEQVSATDNFFSLGGHSLLATQAVSRLRALFHVDLPLRMLFQYPTVGDLAFQIGELLRAGSQLASPPLIPVSRGPEVPLSFAQQRLWFLAQLEPDNPAYTIPQALRLEGPLNISALERAINAIIARHETLRTTFNVANVQPVQSISETYEMHLGVIDLGELDQSKREIEAQNLAIAESRRPFDLSQDYSLRAAVVRLNDQTHVLLLTIHHIASDGWSLSILARELNVIYEAYTKGEEPRLPDLPIQYADFAVWQRKALQGNFLDTQLSYWRQRLADPPAVLRLPLDHSRPTVKTHHGAWERAVFSPQLTAGMRRLSQQEGTTLFMTLLAGFQALLYRYTGQQDICVGTPIANRNRAELDGLIGFFVNTLVMRAKVKGEQTFLELLRQVKEVALSAYAHQELPFERLVEELHPERSLSRNPLFDVSFAMQNVPIESVEFAGLKLVPWGVIPSRTRFDLEVYMREVGDALACSALYNPDLFEAETIERMLGHYEKLLEEVVINAGQPVSRHSLLHPAEQETILVDWNRTETQYPHAWSLAKMFAQQATQTPDSIAVIFEGETLRYGELNRRANQLAHYLAKRGIGPDALVGLCVERSPEMIVGILGILKAGGAYVPLDASYPLERLKLMLEDSRVKVLVTQERLRERLPAHEAVTITLDHDWDAVACESDENPDSETLPSNLAYLMYTSGSTGSPKGVMITHGGLMNYLNWCTKQYRVCEGQGSLVHSPLGFDLTITSLLAPLVTGQQVTLLREDAGIDELKVALRAGADYSLVKLTPSHLEALSHLMSEKPAGSTRALVVGGEALFGETLSFWHEAVPAARIINEYGPTETVVGCCIHEVAANQAPGAVPIGRPIANTRLYVLNDHLSPVPAGVLGELYIGGAGVGRGYLNQPGLTAEKFVPDPFSNKPGERLYKSGDLVRHLKNGELQFIGRIDDQVKLRGFRIEPKEIETVIKSHLQVREVLVLVREHKPGDKRLVAYVVPALDQTGLELRDDLEGAQLSEWQSVFAATDEKQRVLPVMERTSDADRPTEKGERDNILYLRKSLQAETERRLVTDLRAVCQKKLPEHMRPSEFVLLETLPLTANGKIDRSALPMPNQLRALGGETLVSPRNDSEKQLVKIWADVLRREKIGVEDNFFDLGGHSLLATQVVSRIREHFKVELPLRRLFEAPTISELARALAEFESRDEVISPKAIARKSKRQRPLSLSEIEKLSPEQIESLLSGVLSAADGKHEH